MVDDLPEWPIILLVGGKAALVGFSAVLCVTIQDDSRDAAARVVDLHSGGEHED